MRAVRGRGPPKLDMHPSQWIGLDRWGSKKDEVHSERIHRESHPPFPSSFELLLSVKFASMSWVLIRKRALSLTCMCEFSFRHGELLN